MDAKGRVITMAPTLSLGAYSAGDQVGGLLTLENALDSSSDTATVISVVVVDKAQQKAALDILFFNAQPTLLSSDNGALSISDSEMSGKFIGRVLIDASLYRDTQTSSDATVAPVGLMVQGYRSETLYAVVQSQGTPTYTSTSDLTFRVAIAQD